MFFKEFFPLNPLTLGFSSFLIEFPLRFTFFNKKTKMITKKNHNNGLIKFNAI